jgi:[ribosomal protein S18]-alanine N-acetyltransferase
MTPDALAALHARCFTTPPPWSAASFATLLTDRNSFVATDPLERAFVIGRVIAGEAELLTLATAPEARRSGLGRTLMARFDAEARAKGAKTAFLEVAEDNAPARILYSACGWVQTGRRPAYYVGENGAPVAALILCKSLVSALP